MCPAIHSGLQQEEIIYGSAKLWKFDRADDIIAKINSVPGTLAPAERLSCTPLNERGNIMPLFLLFGKYSTEALQGISKKRTKKVIDLIERHGGEIESMYAVLGAHDLVFTVAFPDVAKAMSASLALRKMTGISFTTEPVVDVEEFDRQVVSGADTKP